LFLVHRFLSPWWRRRQVPPKRRFLQEPHGVTTQKTPFFISSIGLLSNLVPYTPSAWRAGICAPEALYLYVYKVAFKPLYQNTQCHISDNCTLELRMDFKPKIYDSLVSTIRDYGRDSLRIMAVLFSTESRPTPWPTQSPILLELLSPAVSGEKSL
jgi:hypothetical protein